MDVHLSRWQTKLNQIYMYRTTNFRTGSHSPPLSPKPYAGLNPQSFLYNAQPNLNQTMARLMKENQIVSQNLQAERQRNFNLLEVKRKMQDDIQKLQFELERIGKYEDLGRKQIQIKQYQLAQTNAKLQAQLDQYFQQNKLIRAQLRRSMSECEKLVRQKEDLVNQNVILLNQIADLKHKISQNQQQAYQVKSKLKKDQNLQKQTNLSLHDVMTIRSTHIETPLPNNLPNKQYSSQNILQSPQSHTAHLMGQQENQSHYFRKKQEISTNPSVQKNSIHSPLGKDQFHKIYEDFYHADVEPSPRSFHNKKIHEKLEFVSPRKEVNLNCQITDQQKVETKSPSVFSYVYQQSPMIYPLKLSENSQNAQKIEGVTWQGEQKKELKNEVTKIRNEIMDELIGKYYKNALEMAQRQKMNSLKLFIAELQPRIGTLDHMVMNYLEARQMLAQSCPTLRLKWETDKFLERSSAQPQESKIQSEVVLKNTVNVSEMFERIKESREKENSLAGQYLALFRLLTLVNKLGEQIDPLLSECIKHTALKQVHRIKSWGKGSHL